MRAPMTSSNNKNNLPTVSTTLNTGELVELIYDPEQKTTAFAVGNDRAYRIEENITLPNGQHLVPYSPQNNLIKHGVVVLASCPEEYGSEANLIADIQGFIHRYVDVSESFERISAYYVLFSWLYDCFNELPYLRLRGDYGSGKTRYLLTVGSLCRFGFFASGASTVSPLFHILDTFKGTLILDEADFRFSDEKAQIVKILNNGNVSGMPVLRTIMNKDKEFNPRAFHVFTPKIIATRGYYEDPALESRFITEEMGTRRIRSNIPLNLPTAYKDEARTLRNKLLLFRLRTFGVKKINDRLANPAIEPRLNQIFVPLLSVISDQALQRELGEVAQKIHKELIADRRLNVEADVLEIIKELFEATEECKVSVKNIAKALQERYESDYGRHISSKWVGGIIRRKLHLHTEKSHGVYIIPFTEALQLQRLYEKYGLAGDMGDFGGVDTGEGKGLPEDD